MNINDQVIKDWADDISSFSDEWKHVSLSLIASVIRESIKRADHYRAEVLKPTAFLWHYASQTSTRLDLVDPRSIHGDFATLVTPLYKGAYSIDKEITAQFEIVEPKPPMDKLKEKAIELTEAMIDAPRPLLMLDTSSVAAARKHVALSGGNVECWPSWASAENESHLTKSGKAELIWCMMIAAGKFQP